MELDMKMRAVFLMMAVLALCGCDASRGASATARQAHVSGRVTWKGKPLANAEIRFNPANVNRRDAAMVSATIGRDGHYEVTTRVGENTVTLGGRLPPKESRLRYAAKTIEVKEGANAFNFRLP